MMRWRMVRNTVVKPKKYTVGNVPPPQKNFPSYSTAQGMTSWNSSIKIWFFFKLIECIIKKKICHGVKQYAKICAIGEQNVIN